MPPRRAKTHDADKGATGTAINEDSFNGDVAQEPSYSMARMNEKLDTLLTARTAQDTQLNLIISKVTSLQSEISLVNGKIEDLQNSVSFHDDEIEECKRNINALKESKRPEEDLLKRIDDLENRNKRNNLVFWGTQEETEKTLTTLVRN